MAKPPEAPPQEGAPEWMVSYADMITIMMAFFVVMYAMAPRKDQEKMESRVQKLLDSIHYRFGPDWQPFSGRRPLTPSDPLSVVEREGLGPYRGIPNKHPSLEDAPLMPFDLQKFRIPGRGHNIVVGGVIYFNDDGVEISPESLRQLKKIAAEMAGKPQKIELLGHAARRPLPPNSPYKSHYELAFARCQKTMDQLVALGIDARRFRIGAAGQNEPMHISDDPILAQENARVDIYLLDVLTEELIGTKKERSKTDSPYQE
jgi:chemotaxis protein MotB